MPGNSSENSDNNDHNHNHNEDPTPPSPTAGSEHKSTDIRAAMSVSNLLTPPAQGSDLPDPPTPIATASAGPSDTKDASTSPALSDTKDAPTSPASCGPAGEPAASDDDKTAIDSSPSVVEADSIAPVDREFICKNDEFADCKTGQYTMDLSRKVISDHFGRNKACTRIIKDWPLFCRKHYQRATYNQALWQVRKVQLILRQFKIIEEQFPGTRYEVALKKSEEQRLNTFSRKVASGVEAEEASMFVMPRQNKNFEAPIDVLRELSMDLGHDKSLDEVEQTVHNILDMLENGETKQVPSIEFLPQIDKLGNPYTKATGGSPKTKSPKAKRIGKKGGIQKPPTPKKSGKSKA